jgi:hypothetical protein
MSPPASLAAAVLDAALLELTTLPLLSSNEQQQLPLRPEVQKQQQQQQQQPLRLQVVPQDGQRAEAAPPAKLHGSVPLNKPRPLLSRAASHQQVGITAADNVLQTCGAQLTYWPTPETLLSLHVHDV